MTEAWETQTLKLPHRALLILLAIYGSILRLILDSGAALDDKITLSAFIIIYILSLVGFEAKAVKEVTK